MWQQKSNAATIFWHCLQCRLGFWLFRFAEAGLAVQGRVVYFRLLRSTLPMTQAQHPVILRSAYLSWYYNIVAYISPHAIASTQITVSFVVSLYPCNSLFQTVLEFQLIFAKPEVSLLFAMSLFFFSVLSNCQIHSGKDPLPEGEKQLNLLNRCWIRPQSSNKRWYKSNLPIKSDYLVFLDKAMQLTICFSEFKQHKTKFSAHLPLQVEQKAKQW